MPAWREGIAPIPTRTVFFACLPLGAMARRGRVVKFMTRILRGDR